MKRNRLIIYPKDIQLITGRGERYAERVIRTIKQRLGKQKHHLVTYEEFCKFAGLSLHDLEEYLK
jgi:tRNA A58 N-methylase Trm61